MLLLGKYFGGNQWFFETARTFILFLFDLIFLHHALSEFIQPYRVNQLNHIT